MSAVGTRAEENHQSAKDTWRAGGEFGAWAYTLTADEHFHDASLQTASWYDEYTLRAGTYPLELVNIDYTPWNPDPLVRTNGYIRNIGPYYARARIEAVQTHEYRESRLLQHVSATHTDMAVPCFVSRQFYAYEVVEGGARGRIHRLEP